MNKAHYMLQCFTVGFEFESSMCLPVSILPIALVKYMVNNIYDLLEPTHCIIMYKTSTQYSYCTLGK